MGKKIIVIGAGVAGQTAALSLEQNGFDVVLYEKSAKILSAIGAGIGISGGALCLTKMGMRHVWEPYTQQIYYGETHKVNGKTIKTDTAKLIKGTVMEGHMGAIKRDDLLNSLYKEMEKKENITIHLGKTAVNYNEIGEKAIVEFSDGSKDEADFIICGDGIHTSSRKYVIDDRDQLAPVHTGLCVYYGVLTNLPPSFPEETAVEIPVTEGATMLMIPLKDKEGLFVLPHKANEEWRSDTEHWSYSVTPEEYNQVFVDKGFYEKQKIFTPDMIKNITRLSHLGVYQHQHLPKWHKGRVLLIGDAAHATSPFLGQGANQAIQDGYLIGTLLKEFPNDHEKAFAQFYKIRNPVTKAIVDNSKKSGEIRTSSSSSDRTKLKLLHFLQEWAPSFLLRKGLMSILKPTFINEL